MRAAAHLLPYTCVTSAPNNNNNMGYDIYFWKNVWDFYEIIPISPILSLIGDHVCIPGPYTFLCRLKLLITK